MTKNEKSSPVEKHLKILKTIFESQNIKYKKSVVEKNGFNLYKVRFENIDYPNSSECDLMLKKITGTGFLEFRDKDLTLQVDPDKRIPVKYNQCAFCANTISVVYRLNKETHGKICIKCMNKMYGRNLK